MSTGLKAPQRTIWARDCRCGAGTFARAVDSTQVQNGPTSASRACDWYRPSRRHYHRSTPFCRSARIGYNSDFSKPENHWLRKFRRDSSKSTWVSASTAPLQLRNCGIVSNHAVAASDLTQPSSTSTVSLSTATLQRLIPPAASCPHRKICGSAPATPVEARQESTPVRLSVRAGRLPSYYL